MFWLAIALLGALQDDLCPLREGTVLTYETRERSCGADRLKEQACSVVGTHSIANRDWFEVSNFLFYEKAYLRAGDDGLEFRAPEYGDHTLLLFKKGARAGDAWECALTDRETARFRYESQETVEVPAGTYRAYRVSFTISPKRRSSVSRESTGEIWIAPGAGVVKGHIVRNPECDGSSTLSFSLKKIETK
ncbi:MAG: DUF3108 domain-containing protein [Planctomycetes bacterium]|nr:DUF3108 domain-containing protein [Planctomycetota bacterium]